MRCDRPRYHNQQQLIQDIFTREEEDFHDHVNNNFDDPTALNHAAWQDMARVFSHDKNFSSPVNANALFCLNLSTMAPLTDSFIDGLLAGRVVKGRMITIPGLENLSESQEAQVIARLQYVPRKSSQFSGGTRLTWRFLHA